MSITRNLPVSSSSSYLDLELNSRNGRSGQGSYKVTAPTPRGRFSLQWTPMPPTVMILVLRHHSLQLLQACAH